jgi:hypothetical protein
MEHRRVSETYDLRRKNLMKVEITETHIIIVDTNINERIPIDGLTNIQRSHVDNIKSFSFSLLYHENNLNTLV